MLPIPATYVIDTEGRIRSAFVEPDFTIREEPAQILASLRRPLPRPSWKGPPSSANTSLSKPRRRGAPFPVAAGLPRPLAAVARGGAYALAE
jgi:hypothetical protein